MVKAIPYGRDPLTCAPCALWRWIAVVDLTDAGGGRAQLMRHFMHAPDRLVHVCRDEHPDHLDDPRPLFRVVTPTGLVGSEQLSSQGVHRMIKRRVAAVGLNPATFGGHSLRAGFVTQAFRNGADGRAIRRQTGHKGDAVLDVYYPENAPMVGNAVTSLGL
jgi:integrase